jgi:hypothetical protein
MTHIDHPLAAMMGAILHGQASQPGDFRIEAYD